MNIFKCKMCGGDIAAAEGAVFGICDSCGGTSTLPKANDEKLVNLFNRANHFRRLNEFDKALATYENILNEDATNAEAHWGVVLCRYGIEYVEDPRTHERVPTCHRTQYASILTDADYLAALEHAEDSYAKSLYEAEAKKISEIQKGILAISSQEQPFDVFICYKESTDGGSRTKDSTLAQDIYYSLTNEGYRVFFAKITLEDKLGREYEPYIFAALNSAKVMLVIGTAAEYFNAVWVKNEWSRFLALMKNDRSRLLIPCYRDMDAYDIPDALSHFQALDMSKIGFVQDLVRGVKKVLEGAVEPTQVAAKAAATVPLVIPKMFAEKPLIDERLKLSQEKASIESQLISLPYELQSKYALYAEKEAQAKRYVDENSGVQIMFPGTALEMKSYLSPRDIIQNAEYLSLREQANKTYQEIEGIKRRIESDNRSKANIDMRISEINTILSSSPADRAERHYQDLLIKKGGAKAEVEFKDLAAKFRRMEGYKDAVTLADECKGLALEAQYGRLVRLKSNVSTHEAYQDLVKQLREMKGYKDTIALVEECERLAEECERLEKESAILTQYDELVGLMNNAPTQDAYQDMAAQLRAMNGYKDSVALAAECERLGLKAEYDRLVAWMDRASREDEYERLAKQFREMNGYENTAALANKCDAECLRLQEQREAQAAEAKVRRLQEEERKKERWRQKGLCRFCGGNLKGWFNKTCTSCGKPN